MMVRRLLLLALWGIFLVACAPRSPWMTFAEYGELEHPTPYVLRWELSDAMLLYFGARHTFDPDDRQAADIAEQWAKLRPTIAFNEGGDPPVLETVASTIARHGEAGLVRYLGALDGVPVHSLEPTYAAQVAALRRSFTSEQIAVYYAIRGLEQYHRQSPGGSPRSEAKRLLAQLATIPGLEQAPRDAAALVAACTRQFAVPHDCLRPSAALLDPARFDTGAFTNALARQLSRYRDEHMVELLNAALRPGARVFAVVGASHVVMQERALDELLTPRLRRGRRR
jgi:hypothetical protein